MLARSLRTFAIGLGVSSVSVFVLSGCGPTPPESLMIKTAPKTFTGTLPEYLEPSTIGLSNGGRTLRIGESVEKAFTLFPQPSRGFPIDDQVPGLPKWLESKGWETTEQGFGVIARSDQVMLVMRQFEFLDVDRFAEELRIAQSGTLETPYRRYKKDDSEFWIAISQREVMVISRTPVKKKQRFQMTVTLASQTLAESLGLLKFLESGTLIESAVEPGPSAINLEPSPKPTTP